MKRGFTFAIGTILLAGLGWTPTATAATEAQKLAAILLGDSHLDAVQALNGSWGGDAQTGAAVFALLTHQSKWPLAAASFPALTVAKYQADVNLGINYLLIHASTQTVSVNNSGVNICPGGTGTCTAVYWNVCGDSTYCTGFVTPAIDTYALTQSAPTNLVSASGACTAPLSCATSALNALTWVQVAQGITNAFAAGQATAANGNRNGGWRYTIPSDTDADMSTTQWGAISSGYDEGVGAVTPAVVKTNLRTYLAYDLSGGAACYEGSGGCGIGPTHSENGGWLTSNAWTGNPPAASVLAWLNTNWKTAPSGTWYGNFGVAYAMWAEYKGLESTIGLADNTHIVNLNTTCGAPGNLPGANSASGGVCNWWEDMNQYLVTTQNANGSWTDSVGEWGDPLNTSFYIAILDAAALPVTITQATNPISVPTLSEWGLVALGILLAVVAAMRIRKGHSRPAA
ncbi:MAG: IPTL-CTERM sorting domain-containing protein [Bryobacteraceae bacterium]|jgi:hypothetical protein